MNVLGSLVSGDGKTIQELKEILSSSMAARSKAESDKMVVYIVYKTPLAICFYFCKTLVKRLDQLEEMLSKKEKFLQVHNYVQ